MVDHTNLRQVNLLYGELNSLDAVEKAFDNGGVIVSMEISPGPLPESTPENPQPPPFGIRVQTSGIEYPPQMIDGIKAQLSNRRHHIEEELQSLGLTGVQTR